MKSGDIGHDGQATVAGTSIQLLTRIDANEKAAAELPIAEYALLIRANRFVQIVHFDQD
jgi:hypothetical protein